MRRLLLGLALLVPAGASAQAPGSCATGRATGDLATPDLFARVFNTGALFYGAIAPGQGRGGQYVVPRGRGTSPVFASALWISGTVGGEARSAAGSYGHNQFWPGPLDPNGTLPNPADCSAYDRIYVVSPEDVAAVEAGGTPSADLREWPVGLGAPAVDAQGQPVPVVSRGQILNLAGGERPVLGGGPTAFWVMNDVGNARAEVGQQPLGVEVRVTAFAPSSGALSFRQSTFYRFTVVNQNSVPIVDSQVGFFVDPDLGDSGDDYVGVDTTRGMAIVYNADDADAAYGIPPALGYDLLSGLWASSRLLVDFNPGDVPATPAEYVTRMRGLWNDGTTIREFGNGYDESQGAVTRFTYTGDPVTGAFWSERQPTPGGAPSPQQERRFMLSAPAVTLAPGEARTVDLAIVFAQGADHLDSITALRAASDAVQAAYDAGTLLPTAADDAPTRAEALALGSPQPNPATAALAVPVSLPTAGRLRLVDVLGRSVVDVRLEAGEQRVRLDTRAIAAGVYAVVLESAAGRAVRTVTVVR